MFIAGSIHVNFDVRVGAGTSSADIEAVFNDLVAAAENGLGGIIDDYIVIASGITFGECKPYLIK